MKQIYYQETVQDVKSIQLLAEKWTMSIVSALSHGNVRFSQLQRVLGVSSKTLSKRLKTLEKEGIVTRTLYAQVPLRVEYELTEKGFELYAILSNISTWEKKWK